MSKVVCQSCNKVSEIPEGRDAPPECPYCFEDMSAEATTVSPETNGRAIAGLTLIYQLDHRRIDVPPAERTVLGRESFGAEVLGKIFFNGKPVISRRHCTIQFRDGQFYLSDDGSLNGTFCGVNKADCKTSARVIEDGSLIYLGEEPFLARINLVRPDPRAEAATPGQPPQPEKPKKYRCNETACGLETQEAFPVCPSCSTYNSLKEIYD